MNLLPTNVTDGTTYQVCTTEIYFQDNYARKLISRSNKQLLNRLSMPTLRTVFAIRDTN